MQQGCGIFIHGTLLPSMVRRWLGFGTDGPDRGFDEDVNSINVSNKLMSKIMIDKIDVNDRGWHPDESTDLTVSGVVDLGSI